jgi:hypothetical protein
MTDAELLAALVRAEDPFMRVLGLLGQLKMDRHKQYNVGDIRLEDYFPFGRMSYIQMMYMKVLRARATRALDEQYLDSIMDLANYAIFAVMKEKKWTATSDS